MANKRKRKVIRTIVAEWIVPAQDRARKSLQDYLMSSDMPCCYGEKALGKTIPTDASSDNKPLEQELPNVKNVFGYRFDPAAKGEPGKVLKLFPTMGERTGLSKQPNVGWVDEPQARERQFANPWDQLDYNLYEGPRVVAEVYEVDELGNPKKKVDPPKDESSTEEKGLGKTIRELNPAGSVAATIARAFRVIVDAAGRFRCPPKTPQANQFTDDIGSTCFTSSARQVIGMAVNSIGNLFDWMQFAAGSGFSADARLHMRGGGRGFDSPARSTVFKRARQRVQERSAELERTIQSALRVAGVDPSKYSAQERARNEHLVDALRILYPHIPTSSFKFESAYGLWENATPLRRKRLEADGYTPAAARKIEEGILKKLIELAVTQPDIAKEIGAIDIRPLIDNFAATQEAGTDLIQGGSGAIKDVKARVQFSTLATLQQLRTQLPEVRAAQRMGLRVEGAKSPEEEAALLHDFVANPDVWAGGMSAYLWPNAAEGKGVHTASHEIAHVVQVVAFKNALAKRYGDTGKIGERSSRQIFDAMVGLSDDISIDDLRGAMESFDAVLHLGGRYAFDEREGGESRGPDVWKLELTAELYAMRDTGIIPPMDAVDSALGFMDRTSVRPTAERRKSVKRRELARIKKNASRPQVREDGSPDVPAGPGQVRPIGPSGKTPTRPSPRRGKTPSDLAEVVQVGADLRRRAEGSMTREQRRALARVDDIHSSAVVGLTNPNHVEMAVTTISANHERAKRTSRVIEEIDASSSEAASRIGYDGDAKELFVTFRGSGQTYVYDQVEREDLEIFRDRSIGAAVNIIKARHSVSMVETFPDSIDKYDLDSANLSQQVEGTLIPLLEALEGSSIANAIQIEIPLDVLGGEVGVGKIVNIQSVSNFPIYGEHRQRIKHARITLPAGSNGIPVQADIFSGAERGQYTEMLIPPGSVTITGFDADGAPVGYVSNQKDASNILRGMVDNWPEGASPENRRSLARERVKMDQIVTEFEISHSRETSRMRPDGSHPAVKRTIARRNDATVARMTRSGSRPTRPDRDYVTRLASRGEASVRGMGEIETPEERRIRRRNSLATTSSQLRSGASPDPIDENVMNIIQSFNDDEIANIVEDTSMQFHGGVDRRVRVRMDDVRLDNALKRGGVAPMERSNAGWDVSSRFHRAIGIDDDADDASRPVGGYVFHEAREDRARRSLKRRGIRPGDAPIEHERGKNPHGDVDADGDIELLLRPEVSGRTAYGSGRGLDTQNRPVWLNSQDPSDVADALAHHSPDDPDGARRRVANIIASYVDGDYSSFNNSRSVKPTKDSANYNQSIGPFDDDASGELTLGAHIMGGFTTDEIAEIRYPWSKVEGLASDVDVSDALEAEPVSDRLRRLGFSDAEIEYYYSLNDNRGLGNLDIAAIGQLRAYRKARDIQKDYEARGIPSVSFSHKYGLDMMDASTYSPDGVAQGDVDEVLSARVSSEADVKLEAMLKQIRKTMRQMAGMSA